MVRFLASGDSALVVEFGETIDPQTSGRVLALYGRLGDRQIDGVVELVPTMRSLMVHYDPVRIRQSELQAEILPLLDDLVVGQIHGARWVLPVCYDAEFGPDLEEVARRTGHSVAEVVRLHASVVYRVYMIGFLPGHPYLGDLPKALELPRRETPRTKVPAGSVSIATTMSNIYPMESPGGWHVLGRTPAKLFDLTRDPAVLLSPADEVRFRPIDRLSYDRMAREGISLEALREEVA